MKVVKIFQPKIVIFTEVKNRCMLHGRVFVMISSGDMEIAIDRCLLIVE